MSYVVLARKYRPPSFEQLVGQEHVVQALSNALTQGRLHHAYLFTGTRGVGKTTVSRILAKSLNCTGADGQGGITAQPCGVCSACRDIDAGRFVDYVELDAASNRGVEEISLLLDQAVYKPVLGRFKVYMIDEVHMLTNHAFNAMLKTLEEPPEYLKFVLATTDPQKVPPTVLSRCLQFNLRPMAPQTVQQHLERVLAAERIDAEPGALRLLARAARGSMRDALSLTDQAVAFGAGTLAEADVRRMLGAVDRSHAVRLIEALAGARGAELVAAVDALRELGLSASGALEEMVALLQQMAVLQAVPDAAALSGDSEIEASVVARLAALLAADETQLLYSIALHGRAEIGLAPDEYSGLVMVLLRALAFMPSADGAGPVRRAATNGNANVRGGAVAAAVPPAPATAVVAAEPAARAVAAARTARAEPPPWVDMPSLDAAPDAVPPAVVPQAPDTLREAPAREPVGVPRPVASALGDRWAQLVHGLIASAGIAALARELALQAQCVMLDETGAPIRCRLRVERENLRAPAHCDKLQTALAQALGRPVELEVEAGATDDTPALRDAAERAHRQQHAEQIIHNDPLVRALMAQYETARIVPGSIRPQ
jgi:DNA polymerase-3 subunit gamma/tau